MSKLFKEMKQIPSCSSWSLWPRGPHRWDHICSQLPGFHPAAVRQDPLQEYPHDAGAGGCQSHQGKHTNTAHLCSHISDISSATPEQRSAKASFSGLFWKVLTLVWILRFLHLLPVIDFIVCLLMEYGGRNSPKLSSSYILYWNSTKSVIKKSPCCSPKSSGFLI